MLLQRSLPVFLVVGVVVALAAPAAASFEINIEDVTIDETIPAGDSRTAEVTVSLTSTESMVCPSDASFDIDLSVEDDTEAGFTGDIPSTIGFSIPTGVYGVGAAEPWEGEESETFTATIDDGVDQNSHTYTITGSYAGGEGPGDCQAAEWPENSGTGSVNVNVEPTDDDENETTSPTDDGDPEESPAPAVGLVLLIGVAVAAARRRQSRRAER